MQEIYFVGGEPLFMEEHYTLLNRMIELGLTDTHIRYSTNPSIMKYKSTRVVDIWKNFENVFCAGSQTPMEQEQKTLEAKQSGV